MMYILGYLRKHFLQYNTLPFKSLGSVNIFFKDVSYAHQGCSLFDKKELNIIPQNKVFLFKEVSYAHQLIKKICCEILLQFKMFSILIYFKIL